MSIEPSTAAEQNNPDVAESLRRENERLRARLHELEHELVEVQTRADAQVAHWQERAYWLDRWHLDLNAIMRRPGAQRALQVLKAGRSVYRALKRAKRLALRET